MDEVLNTLDLGDKPVLMVGNKVDRLAPEGVSDVDATNIETSIVRDGDEYVVTGTKTWVTNGERAGIVALAARTEEGISCLMVEKEPGPATGGITVSRNIGKLGYKGIETVEMRYEEHRVAADALLGDPGRAHLPAGLESLGVYRVATSRELERADRTDVTVYRIPAGWLRPR